MLYVSSQSSLTLCPELEVLGALPLLMEGFEIHKICLLTAFCIYCVNLLLVICRSRLVCCLVFFCFPPERLWLWSVGGSWEAAHPLEGSSSLELCREAGFMPGANASLDYSKCNTLLCRLGT